MSDEPMVYPTATVAWRALLRELIDWGDSVAPRGQRTVETRHKTVAFDMRRPVVACPHRRLSYVFLAAEALWLLSGDDTVAGIAPYNPNIAQFSDDGERFFGAYGPRIVEQLPYALRALREDPDTRRAVIDLWRESPPPSRDVPCTLNLTFMLRRGRLHCHAFMRSSDAWLGVPYDWFNFSMVALKVVTELNRDRGGAPPVELGRLYWTAASSHLYEWDRSGATTCARETRTRPVEPVPEALYDNWPRVWACLIACRDRLERSEASRTWQVRPKEVEE